MAYAAGRILALPGTGASCTRLRPIVGCGSSSATGTDPALVGSRKLSAGRRSRLGSATARMALSTTIQPRGRGRSCASSRRIPDPMDRADETGGSRRPSTAAHFRRPYRLGEQRGLLPRWSLGAHRLRRWYRTAVGEPDWPAAGDLSGAYRLGEQCGLLPRWPLGAHRLRRSYRTAVGERVWPAAGDLSEIGRAH